MIPVLERSLKEKNIVHIKRTIPRSENLNGYVVGLSKEIVVLHSINNFHLDGYLILPISQIESIRQGKYEKFLLKILKNEGVDEKVSYKNNLRIDTWQSALISIKNLKKIVILESDLSKNKRFLIGMIQEIRHDSAKIRNFDGTGMWEEKDRVVKFHELTLAVIDDEYTRIFGKYIKPLRKRRQDTPGGQVNKRRHR